MSLGGQFYATARTPAVTAVGRVSPLQIDAMLAVFDLEDFTMRSVLPVLFMLLLASPVLANATAAAGACYSIADADARTLCLARAHKDPGRCYSIADQGLRAQCLAEVRR